MSRKVFDRCLYRFGIERCVAMKSPDPFWPGWSSDQTTLDTMNPVDFAIENKKTEQVSKDLPHFISFSETKKLKRSLLDHIVDINRCVDEEGGSC